MGIEDDLHAARILGLSDQAAYAYAKLLAHGEVALEPESVNELVASALIDRSAGSVVPIDPESALSTARYRTVNRTQAARSIVIDAFRRARAPGVQPRVGRTRTLSAHDALGAVRRRLIAVGALPTRLAMVEELPPTSGWADRVSGLCRLSAAGVEARVVYRGDPVDVVQGARDELAALAEAGAQARIGRGTGIGFLLVDHDIGWLWSAGSDDAVEVTVPALLVAAQTLFEATWADATEVIGRSESTPTDAQVVHGLAAGLSDEQIARMLGVSARTLSRRITALLADTGCATRFQLAVYAVEKGWL